MLLDLVQLVLQLDVFIVDVFFFDWGGPCFTLVKFVFETLYHSIVKSDSSIGNFRICVVIIFINILFLRSVHRSLNRWWLLKLLNYCWREKTLLNLYSWRRSHPIQLFNSLSKQRARSRWNNSPLCFNILKPTILLSMSHMYRFHIVEILWRRKHCVLVLIYHTLRHLLDTWCTLVTILLIEFLEV